MRKKLFTGCLSLCLLFSICFADEDLKEAKESIIAAINSGQQAKENIDKFLADYSNSPDLPAAIYEIAEKFGYNKNYKDEKNIYQQIITNWPDSPMAAKARLGNASAEIRTFIVAQQYDQAKQATDKLISDFNNHPDLPDVLYRLARGYEWSDRYYEWPGKYKQAKELFEYIVQNYPDSGKFQKAQLGIYRMTICDSIISKNPRLAQDEYNKMMVGFNSLDPFDSLRAGLPETLGHIAKRYESSDIYKEANDIYKQIIENWPESSDAEKAKFDIQRAQIRHLIVTEDFNNAQITLDKFILDFNGHSDLPDALYWIAQRYGYSGRYEEEKNLYESIMQNWPQSLYADKARLDSVGTDILSSLVAGDNNDVNDIDSALEKLTYDFNEHPYLPNALLFIVDKCYDKALKDNNDIPKQRLYHFALETLEKYIFNRIAGKDNEADVYYRASVIGYRLEEAERTIQYADVVLQIDPNFKYGVNMQWLIANGYERMKAKGQLAGSDIDTIIEEAYNDIIDKYPTSRIADEAALHMGLINYRQRNNTKCCAYFGWYLMNAAPSEYSQNRTKGRCGMNAQDDEYNRMGLIEKMMNSRCPLNGNLKERGK